MCAKYAIWIKLLINKIQLMDNLRTGSLVQKNRWQPIFFVPSSPQWSLFPAYLGEDLVHKLYVFLEASNLWGGCDFRFDPRHHITSIEFKLPPECSFCNTVASGEVVSVLLPLLSLLNKTASVSLFCMFLWDWTTCCRRLALLWSSGKDCK